MAGCFGMTLDEIKKEWERLSQEVLRPDNLRTKTTQRLERFMKDLAKRYGKYENGDGMMMSPPPQQSTCATYVLDWFLSFLSFFSHFASFLSCSLF